jgi:hypothetical protein
MTMMFCSFSRKPVILRLYGQGRAIQPRHQEWAGLAAQLPSVPGARQIILLKIEAVQTSCGFGVPMYEYQGERETLVKWAAHEGAAGMAAYQEANNQNSLDGLPTHLFAD